MPITEKVLSENPDFFLGLFLAVISSVFIGSSFIIKKISLKRLNQLGEVRAGSGGYGYLRDWIWWLGLIDMGLGELANFAAYAFAPASLVTPLGALSVLVSAILASKYLDETLNFVGKIGCFLCILGATLIVIYSPKNEEFDSLDELLLRAQDSAFLNFVIISCCGVICLAFFVAPRYGNKYVIIYITMCSAVGSLSIMACKILGIALKNIFSGTFSSNHIWTLISLILIVVCCIAFQMIYLNKALDLFDTSVVTPIYYVIFTSFVLVASSLLFREWTHMKTLDIVGSFGGYLVAVVAIFLLSYFKSYDQTRSKSYSREYSSTYYARTL